jgi:hypothetical protein
VRSDRNFENHSPGTATAPLCTKHSPQKIGYMVGKWQIMRLLGRYRDQEGAAFRLGGFHDKLISYGSLPVSDIEWLMFGDSTAVRATSR